MTGTVTASARCRAPDLMPPLAVVAGTSAAVAPWRAQGEREQGRDGSGQRPGATQPGADHVGTEASSARGGRFDVSWLGPGCLWSSSTCYTGCALRAGGT